MNLVLNLLKYVINYYKGNESEQIVMNITVYINTSNFTFIPLIFFSNTGLTAVAI